MRIIVMLDSFKRDSILCLKIAESILLALKNEIINLDLLKTNESSHFSYYIEKEPDFIICNPHAIMDGNPVKFEDYNCEITDYKKNYYRLETKSYEENPLREYFFDPYKEIRVYIKNHD